MPEAVEGDMLTDPSLPKSSGDMCCRDAFFFDSNSQSVSSNTI